MKSLGVLTNLDANHGSSIFNISLNEILGEELQDFEITYLNYLTPSWYIYEILRALKPYQKIPLYNFKRYQTIRRFNHNHLQVEPFFHPLHNAYDDLVQGLIARNYHVLVVGKVVWDIAKIWQTPTFPNIFWLSEILPSTKIAYAVSGHRTDVSLFHQRKEEVKRILSSYALIGVRDDLTMEMMVEAGVDENVPVHKVCDPAFQFKFRPANTRLLLSEHEIDPDRPILGLLYYGKPELSKAVCEYYRGKGFQIINFNMYNPYADVNLGHLVDPFEWAELFRHLTFCITDRFHCSIFCLRTNVPFVAIEPVLLGSLLNSKIYSLLKDFDLLDCYQDPNSDAFNTQEFLDLCSMIEIEWESSLFPKAQKRLDRILQEQAMFVQEMQDVVKNSSFEE